MTHSAAAPPPPAVHPAPAPAPPAQVGRGARPAPTGAPEGAGVEDTPGLLNRLQVVGMAAVLVFGLLSGLIQLLSYQSDGRAADDTEQLVRIQEIQSTLLRADALATNEFLIGGEGDTQRREDYNEAIDDVFQQIAAAAEAQPADQAALEALVVEISDYTTAVTEARVNNRQQKTVGAEYLSSASAALRTEGRPILDNLVAANTERAEDSMSGQHPFWLLLLGIATLVVLVWLNLQLARRFHRFVNVGVAVAGVIVLVVTLVATAAAWRGDNQNDALLDGELRTAVDQAAARTAGNDAKAYESLRLIKQGSGSVNEPAWEDAAAIVEGKSDPAALGEWEAYAEKHAEIAALDDRDRWFRAKQAATDDADGGATALFDAFDSVSEEIVDVNGTATTEDLRAGRLLALIGSLLTIVLGIAAAIAVARGVGARRREYA